MKSELYDAIRTSEAGWWYRERAHMIEVVLRTYAPKKKNAQILDWGAGYGALMHVLSLFGTVDAVENHRPCKVILTTRGYRSVYADLVKAEQIQTRYDLVTFFDVLEHIQNDENAMHVAHDLLADSGYVMATVPAYQFLYGPHDVGSKHFRRYAKTKIVHLFEKTGFRVVYASYWNSLLLPISILLRMCGRGGGDCLRQPKMLDSLLGKILALETRVLPYASLPFGLSIVVVGRKKTQEHSRTFPRDPIPKN